MQQHGLSKNERAAKAISSRTRLSLDIAIARRMAAQGCGVPEIVTASGWAGTDGGLRFRLKSLGISTHGNRRSHYAKPVTHPKFEGNYILDSRNGLG